MAASYWYLEGAQWLTTEAKDTMNAAVSLLSSERSQEMAQIALWPVYMYCAGGTHCQQWLQPPMQERWHAFKDIEDESLGDDTAAAKDMSWELWL